MKKNQNGIALAITLILISVMLVVGVTSMRLAGNIEAMAGNARDYEVAYQAAEAGLKSCELRLRLFVPRPGVIYTANYANIVLPEDPIVNGKYYWERGVSFWNDPLTSNAYLGPLNEPNLLYVSAQPRCIVESYHLPADNTQEYVELVPAYKVTSLGVGARGSTSKVYLQAIVRL